MASDLFKLKESSCFCLGKNRATVPPQQNREKNMWLFNYLFIYKFIRQRDGDIWSFIV